MAILLDSAETRKVAMLPSTLFRSLVKDHHPNIALVKPTIEEKGKGKSSYFGLYEVFKLLVLARLSDMDLGRATLGAVSLYLDEVLSKLVGGPKRNLLFSDEFFLSFENLKDWYDPKKIVQFKLHISPFKFRSIEDLENDSLGQHFKILKKYEGEMLILISLFHPKGFTVNGLNGEQTVGDVSYPHYFLKDEKTVKTHVFSAQEKVQIKSRLESAKIELDFVRIAELVWQRVKYYCPDRL